LTTFFFDCQAGWGRLVGSFTEFSTAANAYRAELLGLMTVHLVLQGVAELHPNLGGKLSIYSDYAGALDKLSNLPQNHLPAKSKHADIPKTYYLMEKPAL
jgi:hypothetical protein